MMKNSRNVGWEDCLSFDYIENLYYQVIIVPIKIDIYHEIDPISTTTTWATNWYGYIVDNIRGEKGRGFCVRVCKYIMIIQVQTLCVCTCVCLCVYGLDMKVESSTFSSSQEHRTSRGNLESEKGILVRVGVMMYVLWDVRSFVFI